MGRSTLVESMPSGCGRGHAQRFLATFGVITSFFRPGRHLLAVRNYRGLMGRRLKQWAQVISPVLAGV